MSEQPSRVSCRVDASEKIGSGHVARCVALAQALRDRGSETTFLSRALTNQAETMIREQAFPIILTGATDGTDWKEDAEATRAILPMTDWLIVDHYDLDARWHSAVRDKEMRVLVIDDLANRPYACDVLIDPGRPESELSIYDHLVPPDCQIFGGPRYALLRHDFRELHDQMPGQVRTDPLNLLIFFGSVDGQGLTEIAIQSISDPLLSDRVTAHIVTTDANPRRQEIREVCDTLNNVVVHENVSNMADLLQMMDISLGSGGVALWERCCAGIPGIAVNITENQTPSLVMAEAAGAIKMLGLAEAKVGSLLTAELASLVDDPDRRSKMVASARTLVDGGGANRVSSLICPIKLRPVKKNDGRDLWLLANEPSVRAMAYNQNTIAWDEHIEWLHSKLENKNTLMLIAENRKEFIGQIRFDFTEDAKEAIIDISIASEQRGKGFGINVLLNGLAVLNRLHPGKTAIAWIKNENAASYKLFTSVGFYQIEQNTDSICMAFKF